ncbi:cytochrome c oxidase assembly protein [Nocardiopsis coralli]|uniref:cytochrome c oxidase assembly protein n=1 Tax=Nocardiopsis coralli TaxID=2772213 RepID=UPI002E2C1756|nr:cytochrome c oxidase assembly protein [Nocardiopsis coralli]
MAPPAQNDTSTQVDHPDAPGTGRVPLFAGAAVVLSLASLALTLVLGGAAFPEVIPGLPDSGEAVRWGYPIAKVVMDGSALMAVGLLLMAVVFLPSERGRLTPQAVGYVRAATWAALAWAVAAVFTLYFQAAEFLAATVGQVSVDEVTAYAGSVGGGIALMFVVLLTTGVALFGRTVVSATGGLWLLVFAGIATTPPALTGHSASAGAHELAVTGLALHIITVCAWVGGLIAVAYHAMRRDAQDPVVAVNRFSRTALWLYIGVAISGVASALARLYSLEDLFLTEYGLIIVVKAAIFAVLGVFGYMHRTSALKRIDGAPAGAAGETLRRGLFLRLASVEALIMASVVGVSVGLGRTAPPPPPESEVDPAAAILGFPVPPPMDLQNILTLWRPDLFFIMFVVVAGGLYLGGVMRLRRRGDSWPIVRTVAFTAGLLTIVAVQLTGFATYAMVLFSQHMIQHMVISMLTPILLVLGAPATLALRALKPARVRGDRGPREWVNLFLNSRFSQVVTHPGVAAPLFVFSPYVLYFTPLFPALMNDHLGHMFMSVHFLITGFLFYWIIIGLDPAPRKVPFLLRILLLFVVMAFHAFFGVTIMMQTAPMAMDFYSQFEVPWSDQAEDQYAGGGIAWALGEIPTLLVTVALLFQWSKDDERTERRRARHASRGDSDDADMDAYNAYLAELARRSGGGTAVQQAPERTTEDTVGEDGDTGSGADGDGEAGGSPDSGGPRG